MGLLRHFDLSLIEAQCFVETGLENGNGVDHALSYEQFKELHSIEINEKFYNFGCTKYKHVDRLNLWCGSSAERLEEVVESIAKFKSCFFWLDAHLPSDPGSRFKHDRKGDDIEFPLEREIEIITRNRDVSNDCFLIDDLRIYIDGPFQYPGSSWPHHKNYPDFFPHKEGIKFAEDAFGSTHSIKQIYDHEGYLFVTPKDTK
jgi:hypothetical protein